MQTQPARKIELVSTVLIDPDPNQPRKHFDQSELQELAESIQSHGILQPILVRPGQEARFSIIAGERRWRAAKLAKLEQIPCIVRTGDDAGQTVELQLVENLQRSGLTPLEIAESLRSVIEASGIHGCELAKRLGRSPAWVSQHLALLDIPPCWRNAMLHPGRAGMVATEGAIRELRRLTIIDRVATVKPQDAKTWSEAYGRSCLFGSASDAPRRTQDECHQWADRVLAWLDWACREIPAGGCDQQGGTSNAVFPANPGPEQSDWMYASYLFNAIRPDLGKLNDSERQKLQEAAARVDFKTDPFVPDWCNMETGQVA